MKIQFLCLGVGAVVALTGSADSSSLKIAERGRAPVYSIVLPEQPGPSEQFAAEEFRYWTEKLTGVRLPIVTNAVPERAVCLNPERPDAALGDEAFRLTVRGKSVCVSGGKRGVLYGVYELLETYGGIAWLAADFTDVPKIDVFSVPADLAVEQKPAFVRRVHDWGDTWGNPAFVSHSRINSLHPQPKYGGCCAGFDAVLHWCHTFHILLNPEEHFDKHPEYFSYFKGKRQKKLTQLCMTNPDVRRIVTEKVLERVRYNQKNKTGVKYYGVSQDDWNGYCECTNCAAIDAREGSHSGALVDFINHIAAEVEKVDPEAVVETLAYMYSRRPPKHLKLRHNVMPMLCSIECDFSKPMGTSRFKENVDFRADVEKWRDLSQHMCIWDYTGCWRDSPCPHGNLDALKGNAMYYRDNGVTEVFYEGLSGGKDRSTEFAALKAWLCGKFLWNPDQPLQPLLDRFCRAYYGKGAPYVLKYIDLLRQQPIDETKTPFTYHRFIEDKPYTDAFLAEGCRLWHQAEAAVAGSDPQVVSNVFWGTFGIDYARIAAYMRRRSALWKPIIASRATAAALDRKEYEEMRAIARRLDKIIREAPKGVVPLSSFLYDDQHKGYVRALAESSFPEPGSVDKVLIQDWALDYPNWPKSTTSFREADPDATDGRAIRVAVPQGGWHLHCDSPKLMAIDLNGTYRLRARVKIPKADAAKQKSAIGQIGVHSYAAKKDLAHAKITPADATGVYVWIDVGSWKMTDANFAIYLSPEDCSSFWFDCVELSRVD